MLDDLNSLLEAHARGEDTTAQFDQFMADPHVRARGIITEVPDPDMGSLPMHPVVPRLSGRGIGSALIANIEARA